MRRLALYIILSLLIASPCWAGSIRLDLPDDTLRYIVDKTCNYESPFTGQGHCEADRNGGAKTSEQKANWLVINWLTPIANNATWMFGRGRAHALEELHASFAVAYTHPPQDWPLPGCRSVDTILRHEPKGTDASEEPLQCEVCDTRITRCAVPEEFH